MLEVWVSYVLIILDCGFGNLCFGIIDCCLRVADWLVLLRCRVGYCLIA